MQQRGSVPVPDPTTLTTNAVARAREEIEKLFDTRLQGFKDLVASEFRGRDTALAAALKAAQELVKQQNDSNTLAFDKAALSTTKQIDALAERIDDLKERLAKSETGKWGAMGGYVVGALGVAAIVAAALLRH